MNKKIAWILVALLALSLAATSLVSARSFLTDDVMTSHLITIPEGSISSSYDGNYYQQDRTIPLISGWSTNLPLNTCAVAVRFAYKDNIVDHWAALRPSSSDAFAVLARTQTANVWSDIAGIVPVNTYPPTMFLDISNPGYVYVEITGYWLCDDYGPRPTVAP